MSRFLSRDVRQLIAPATLAVAIAAAVFAGCGRDRETAQAAANAPIGIETSQLFVTVENKAGAPLTDLEVAIVTVSSQRFTKVLSRIEDGEKRDVSLSDFAGRDGTTFNLRFNTPKNVEVKATDVASRKYDVVSPWR